MKEYRPTFALDEGSNYPAPFTRILGLDYCDGPTAGILECGESGVVFKFDLVEEVSNGDEREARIFKLAPLSGAGLVQLASALGQFMSPHWPTWVPIWRFPTPAHQATIEHLTDEILGQAGPVSWVIATDAELQTIIAARRVDQEQAAKITDWPAFLGIPREPSLQN